MRHLYDDLLDLKISQSNFTIFFCLPIQGNYNMTVSQKKKKLQALLQMLWVRTIAAERGAQGNICYSYMHLPMTFNRYCSPSGLPSMQ